MFEEYIYADAVICADFHSLEELGNLLDTLIVL